MIAESKQQASEAGDPKHQHHQHHHNLFSPYIFFHNILFLCSIQYFLLLAGDTLKTK
jgi:hypothetical protein